MLGFLPLSRGIVTTTGEQSILVVEVTVVKPDGVFPSESKEDISKRVFGGDSNLMDVTTIYKTCSHEKLFFTKAPDRDGANIAIRNGTFTLAFLLFVPSRLVPTKLASPPPMNIRLRSHKRDIGKYNSW
jgi:hypothetical protein